MQPTRLVAALAVAFGAMTALLVTIAAVLREPFVLFASLPMGIATYFFWYHASGRLRDRVRRTTRRRTRETGRRTSQSSRSQARTQPETSAAEAYRRLGLETDASEAEIKRAYREAVKEVHPDRGGDEEAFKQITEAYERLVE